MNPTYERNLNFLKKAKPDLTKKLIQPFTSDRITIFPSRTGPLTLRVTAGKKKITFHSAFDPEKEGKKIIDTAEISPTANVAVLGLGFGYHIRELLSRKAERGFIILIEKDTEIFQNYLCHFNIKEILEQPNVLLFLDEPITEIFRYLQTQTFDVLANGVRVISHQPSMDVHKDYYLHCIKAVGDAYNWSRVNTVTQIRKGETFSDNTAENFSFRLKSPGIAMLKNAFKGFPGIIVATGPSLRKNLNQLRMAKNRSVILSCDSSLKLLAEEGIMPDFVFSIDFTENTINDFEGIDSLEQTFVVVDPEVCPSVVKKYPGRLFFIDLPEKPLCEWLASISCDKGKIEKGLSVSHTAFLAAIYMGLNPVILTGQDLSFPSDETHARGTSLGFPLKQSSLLEEKKFLVKNIFGFPVRTDKSLLVFLHHYRDIINRHPDVRVIDATEGGAEIEGAEILSLKDTILTFCREDKDTVNIIRKLHETGKENLCQDSKNLVKAVKKKAKGLESLRNFVQAHLDFIKKVEKMFQKNDYKNLQKNLSKIEKQPAFLNAHRNEISLLRDNITEALVMQAKRITLDFQKDLLENKDALSEIISRNRTFFEILNEATKKMHVRLEMLAKKLEITSAGS